MTMKVLLLSDLHLESNPDVRFESGDADVVILAGDIATGTAGVKWAGAMFSIPVIYVLGNHEFYGHAFDTLTDQCRGVAARHVHVLDRGEVTMGGVRFLGASLWTDFKLFGSDRQSQAMRYSAKYLNDYHQIHLAGYKSRLLQPEDTLQTHIDDRAWLAECLAAGPLERTVVVTHHAPHRGSLSIRFAENPITSAFVSDVGELLGHSPIWVHGHTHDSFDYRVGQTRVICNPMGYRGTINPMFDPELTFDV